MRDEISSQSSSSFEEDAMDNNEYDHLNLLSNNDDISHIPTNIMPQYNRNKTPLSLLFPNHFFSFEAPSQMIQARIAISNGNRNMIHGITQTQKMSLFRILFAVFHLLDKKHTQNKYCHEMKNSLYHI